MSGDLEIREEWSNLPRSEFCSVMALIQDDPNTDEGVLLLCALPEDHGGLHWDQIAGISWQRGKVPDDGD